MELNAASAGYTVRFVVERYRGVGGVSTRHADGPRGDDLQIIAHGVVPVVESVTTQTCIRLSLLYDS